MISLMTPTINPDDTLLFYYSGHGVPDVDGHLPRII